MIVATGASARQLGLASEQRAAGRGVSYCATCDAAFFRDKGVVVVGGGDSAMEEALFISRFASRWSSCTAARSSAPRRSWSTARASNEKIEFVLNKVVDEVLGDGKVSGVRVGDTETGEARPRRRRRVRRDRPRSEHRALPRPARPRADTGYLLTRARSTETNMPGVFAAGDVQDHVYRQAVTAAGSGLRGGARRRALAERTAPRRPGGGRRLLTSATTGDDRPRR